jgi:hypothetical protein
VICGQPLPKSRGGTKPADLGGDGRNSALGHRFSSRRRLSLRRSQGAAAGTESRPGWCANR